MSAQTPGPWGLRGYQIRADEGAGQHVGTYVTNKADGVLMANAPELRAALEWLLTAHARKNKEMLGDGFAAASGLLMRIDNESRKP